MCLDNQFANIVKFDWNTSKFNCNWKIHYEFSYRLEITKCTFLVYNKHICFHVVVRVIFAVYLIRSFSLTFRLVFISLKLIQLCSNTLIYRVFYSFTNNYCKNGWKWNRGEFFMFTEELRLTHFHNSMCIISVSSLNDFVLDITVFLVTPLLYVNISFPI